MSRRVVAQAAFAAHPASVSQADREAAAAALEQAGARVAGVEASHVGLHLALSVGGGDLTWDLLFDAAEAADRFVERATAPGDGSAAERLAAADPALAEVAATLSAIDFARPATLAAGRRVPGLVGVKRTLWLRVLPEATPDRVRHFEAETPLLAAAIPAIRNWRWSRIAGADPARAASGEGPRFTHLWEQEFETVAGLEVDYMSSPVHWGYVDRYFDPEMPDFIVDPALAHLACPAHAPILSWEAASSD